MKVVFLDIDGVLNTPHEWGLRPAERAFNAGCVGRASRLVEAADAYVVISSTWRLLFPIEEIRKFLHLHGFAYVDHRVIDITPNHRTGVRAGEIKAWLDSHTGIEAYAVLDDDTAGDGDWDDVEGHFIRIDPYVGLQDPDCDAALDLLGGAVTPTGGRVAPYDIVDEVNKR